MTDVATAQNFVATCKLPDPPPPGDPDDDGLSDIGGSSLLVGGDLLTFVEGVPSETREDIVNAFLFAQLYAKNKIPTPKNLDEWVVWYGAYFEALGQVGFLFTDIGFSNEQATAQGLDAHRTLLETAVMLLGSGSPAVAAVAAVLRALGQMNEQSPWIRLYRRESQSSHAARFQLAAVERDHVWIVAFGVEATATTTQVLFFKAENHTLKVRRHESKLMLNTEVLRSVHRQLTDRLARYASDFIRGLPDLPR